MLKRLLTASIVALCPVVASASSHREAPLITASPKLDCSDFYLFNSYEPGRSNHVTLVANYLPLQDAYGGPNYFQLDPDAMYEIHVDNNGDAVEDLTFRFRFTNTPRGFGLPVGPEGNRRTNDVPVLAVGPVTAADQGALLVDQTYTLGLVRGPRRTGAVTPIANAAGGSTTFTKPQDFVGTKTFPDYDAYANAYIYEIALPGTDRRGRLFVGQRKDPFVVNLGETFDLINISTSPLGPEDANRDSLRYKNVTALVLELPTEFLVGTNGPVIGAWTTASRVSGETSTQVSRLSMPLVNEVVIGAPAVLTEDLLTTFNVSVVARGTTTEMTPPAMLRGVGGTGAGIGGATTTVANSLFNNSRLLQHSHLILSKSNIIFNRTAYLILSY